MEKIAIVTGANGQLGTVLVKHLKDRGYFVYAVDISFNIPSSTSSVENVVIDITDADAVRDFYESIEVISLLINNAGVGVFTPFEQRTAEEFKSVMEVNLLGTFLMSQGAIKLMKPLNEGKIVNIASIYGSKSSDERIYGQSGRNNSEVYSASKAGVISLTKYMAAHFGKYNIQTNSISPGGIYNNQSMDFVENYIHKTPMGRMATPADFLSTLDYLISERTAYTNGQNIVVDGGFSCW